MTDNKSKTVVISGANRGIGLELAKIYANHNYQVIGLCRKSSGELKEVSERVVEGVDITERTLAAQAVKAAGFKTIDVLINNSGLFENETWDNLDEESILRQFQVNALGALWLTKQLGDFFTKGTKLGFVTSRMGSIEDNTSGGYYGYRASKAALNAFGKSLAVDLKPQGISVALLHPGYVKTRMTGFQGEITAEDSARGLFQIMENLNTSNSGGFWHTNGETLPW